jgi:dTDP-4-dehydrorhamnose 3,5-epimerase
VKFLQTDLPGVVIVEPAVHRDPRGFFFESYHAERYKANGIPATFVQDNQSRSMRGTLRGLHLQVSPRAQAKLVRAIVGEIYDVAVDVRRGSPTFGKWTGAVLSADTFRQFYVPPGFAHGFAVTSEIAEIEYKCSDFYDPASEIGIAWNDPALGIRWPIEHPLLSDRDCRHPPLAALIERLPVYES